MRQARGLGLGAVSSSAPFWARFLLALGAGVLASLAQPPAPAWAFAGLAAALPLLMGLQAGAETRARAFWLGWGAGLAYFGHGLRWIAEAFQVDAAAHAWMAPFAVGGLAAGLAIFWGLAFALAPRGAGISGRLGLAAIWALAEFARGHVFTGFPWALFAYAALETPFAQTGALIGPYGQTLAILAAAALLAGAWAAVRGGGAVKSLAALAGAALLIGGGWAYGLHRLAEPLAARPDAPLIGILQPNIPQKEKWDPALMSGHLQLLLDMTTAVSEMGAKAVIWPESAAPWPLDHPRMRELTAPALGPETLLIAGTQRVEAAPPERVGLAQGAAGRDRWFNSVTILTPSGAVGEVFDKKHLVPFGEYMPFSATMERLGISKLVQAPGDFQTGAAPRLMRAPGLPAFAPLICYEAIFPEEVVEPGERPEWFAHLTNDAWFGVSAGPWQHLAQARARAIEQGIPALRAANTGISAVIDARGQILDKREIGTRAAILAALPPSAAPTPYGSWREIPFWIVVSFLILFSLRRNLHK